MSAESVLSAMSPDRHCCHTGLAIPECSCGACHREQLRRHAPTLLKRCLPTFDLEDRIVPPREQPRPRRGTTLAESRDHLIQLEVRS
jgi:hypothetical protein